MARNKVRICFTLENKEVHTFMDIYQMESNKSIYFNTLLDEEEYKKFYYINEDNTITNIPTSSNLKCMKVSIHSSNDKNPMGVIHTKMNDNIIFSKAILPPLEKIKYPLEICGILPVKPDRYPLRRGIRKKDSCLDISWMKDGSFGVKILY